MLYRNFSLFDGIFIYFYWMIFDYFGVFVHPHLRAAYLIFNVSVAVFLIVPSFTNPGKRTFQALFFWAVKDRRTYRSECENLAPIEAAATGERAYETEIRTEKNTETGEETRIGEP
jgi:hypothetical protein